MHLPVDSYYLTIRGKNFNNTFGAGIRTDEKTGNPRDHQGWDIAAFIGTPVYAITDGTIEFIDNREKFDLKKTNDGLGKRIGLRFEHKGQTLFALYAHLSSVEVVAGQAVKEGQRLGRVGQTGNAQGQHHSQAHLHFEVRTKPHTGLGIRNHIDPMFLFGIGPVLETIFSDLPKF